MTTSSEGIKQSTADFSLMYNYVVRVFDADHEGLRTPSRPLVDGECIKLGGRYKESCGYLVTINRQVPDEDLRYWHGFQFRGNNGVWYKPNGCTTPDDSSSVNQITEVVE